jgi:peptide/nickel transport system substrate-binding protein
MMSGAVSGSILLAGCGGVNTTNSEPGEMADKGTDRTQQGENPEMGGGGTFIGVTPENAPTLDPRMNELSWYNSFAFNLFSTLYMVRPDGSGVVPHVAKEQPIRKADTIFEIPLRNGVKFHDGKELTAGDVAYSINWILNPENKSTNRANLTFIKNVEVIDPYRVQFNLKYPYALFTNVLAGMNAPIVPKHAAEKMGKKKFGEQPVGSGPFAFEEFKSASHITLSRFEDYFLKKPKLATVKYRVIPKSQVQFVELATGNIHAAGIPNTLLNKARNQSGIEIKLLPQLDYNGLIFNGMRKPFDTLKVRKAMQYLVDYDAILKASKGKLGKRSYGFMPKSVNKNWNFPWKKWAKKFYPSKDHEKAKQLLAEAGYSGGIDKTLKISSLASADFKDMAIIFQNQLKKVGINAEVHEVTIGQWLNQLDSGDYDVTIYGWAGGVDPDGFYYYLFRDPREDKKFNTKKWEYASAGRLYQLSAKTGKYKQKLTEADNKIRTARETQNHDKRRTLYIDAAEIWQGLYPHLPVYSELSATGWRKCVNDYSPTAFEAQLLCNEWANVSLNCK